MKAQSLLLCLIGALCPLQIHAENLQQGITAFDNKDFDTAYRILKPLAEQGNARAQSRLGLIYLDRDYEVKEMNEKYKNKKVSARSEETYTATPK